MSNEKICQKFLRAAASTLRKAGLARGTRREPYTGHMCMLGAMDNCGIHIKFDERKHVERHVASLLRLPSQGIYDTYNNGRVTSSSPPSLQIACWNNMVAFDTEEVAAKLDLAAESC